MRPRYCSTCRPRPRWRCSPSFRAATPAHGCELVLRGFRSAALITLAGMILALLLGPTLLPVVFGAEFDASVTPFLLLLPGALGFVAMAVFSSGLAASDATGALVSWSRGVTRDRAHPALPAHSDVRRLRGCGRRQHRVPRRWRGIGCSVSTECTVRLVAARPSAPWRPRRAARARPPAAQRSGRGFPPRHGCVAEHQSRERSGSHRPRRSFAPEISRSWAISIPTDNEMPMQAA